MKKHLNNIIQLSVVLTLIFIFGCAPSGELQNKSTNSLQNAYSWINLDTVKAGRFDTGKMWTFDFPPLKYFEEEYHFRPTAKWLDDVRMSALRFANYCSASFVSADGLVMTNHHCGRQSVEKVTQEGEDLFKNGFSAKTLEDERLVPGLYVDQLVLIKDVTSEVQAAINKGATDQEKIINEKKIISKIEKREDDSTGLRTSVIRLYNGGKYSLYGYKRYNDVRLVFSPEADLGFFGGDPDNFTYPRYDLDFNFFRVYENGVPLKTDHFFKWSPNGAAPGEPVFVVGNPGRTNRLKTVAQLEYLRDVQYPRRLEYIDGLVNIYSKIIAEHPERATDLQNLLFRYSNSQKAYTGMLKGLRDPVLMQRKIDFERKFQQAVHSNEKLNAKYGQLWNKIARTMAEMTKFSNTLYALTLSPSASSEYFYIAQDVVDLAREQKLSDDIKIDSLKEEKLDSTIADIFPANFDYELNNSLLQIQINNFYKYLGATDPLVKNMTDGKSGKPGLDYMLNHSVINTPEKLKALLKEGPDAILNSKDPFIYFIVNSEPRITELQNKSNKIMSEGTIYSRTLGRALFDVYGTSIPPDATFTLRISDGVIEGYPYNGTEAPPFTTFYGLYDRYYSFGKKAPWDLPKKWQQLQNDLKLETPLNFVSTNDIIGGNSGSPVINENAEIVGLAFDGNIESLPGVFIFTTEKNRTVAVHSAGIMEALKDMYHASRLSDELKYGKIVNECPIDSTAK